MAGEYIVRCGQCGGTVYMETCENQGGVQDHIWVTASECQSCGERNVIGPCPDCAAADVFKRAEIS